jgi:hypothetical protein
MKGNLVLAPKFVEFIPRELEANTIYISIPYATAIHNCCCGCGGRVVTPLSPTDWQLIFDGRSVSLKPSIGNWRFQCRSHYWIRNNRVIWAADENATGKKLDARATAGQKEKSPEKSKDTGSAHGQKSRTKKRSFKSVVKKWFSGET